jgi:hypothetical protein
VLIPLVEEGLEKVLRESLPLPADVGDISFDPPASTWSAQLSRLTVNLFLYEVSRSTQPGQSPARRQDGTGRIERRVPLPMIELAYMVSAWAGSSRDEHQLLSDVLYTFLTTPIIAPSVVDGRLASNVQLAMAVDERNRPRDLWSTLGSTPKGAFTITATVAADAFDWRLAARSVSQISGMAAPKPRDEPEPAAPRYGPMTVRRENGRLIGETAPVAIESGANGSHDDSDDDQ